LKRVLAIFVVVSMVVNGFIVYDEYLGDGGGSGWLSDDGNGEGDSLDKLTVTVPEYLLGDLATYDYDVLAEMYWEDYETGNWSLYRLTIDGQLRHWIDGRTHEARDGFWNKHNTWKYKMDTQASFELFVDGHDADPLIIGGSLSAKRNEYRDLTNEVLINSFTEGNVEIDRLPQFNVPLSFEGLVDAYPNPNKQVEETLVEQIYGGGQQISLNDNGTVVQKKYYEEWDWTMETYFNWSAEKAIMLQGYKTLQINITSEFLEFLNFNEVLWISSDASFPIRRYTKTNQTWEDEDGLAYIIIETDNTLVEDGFYEGDTDIPYDTCKGKHWDTAHPDGEFKDWGYIPVAGDGYSASSFDFRTEDADKFAQDNSPGLQSFLNKYDKPGRGVTVIYSSYNASRNPLDLTGKAGTYRWNLTYGYNPTESESREARETGDWNFTYNVVVIKNVTKEFTNPFGEYEEAVEIEYDWGLRRDYAAMHKEQLPAKTLTMAASEDIMMKHHLVEDLVTDRNGEIEWGDFDTTYGLGLAGLGGEGPGFMMLEVLTGIVMPSAEYAWVLQQSSVYESGDTFSAAVDADSGQLVFVIQISGTQLIGIFG